MRFNSLIAVLPFIALASLVAACGDDDDGSDADPVAGASGSAGAQTSGGSAGSGNQQPSGGTSGSGNNQPTAGAANTGAVPGDTPLSDIDTDPEARTVCERVASEISEADVESMESGLCALSGLLAELVGGSTCEVAQAECIASGETEVTDLEMCTAEDIPDCENVTVDEYVACNQAVLNSLVEAYSAVTCESDVADIGAVPETPAVCVGPFERCPEMNAFTDSL